jgi:Leucine-rich repeat (LRR) protein
VEPLNLKRLLEWSTNNQQIHDLLQAHRYRSDYCVKSFYQQLYSNLTLMRMGITVLDAGLLRFSNLKYLNLMFNRITTLENLPGSLLEVQASFNHLTNFRAHPRLETLGLVSNKLGLPGLAQVVQCYPTIKYLDLSHNDLAHLEDFIARVGLLPELRILGLRGNPLSTPANVLAVAKALPQLKYVDDRNVQELQPVLLTELPSAIVEVVASGD